MSKILRKNMRKKQAKLNTEQGYGQVRTWRHKEQDRIKRARAMQLEKELEAKADKILGKGYLSDGEVVDVIVE